MKIITRISEARKALKERQGETKGLVPTMGAFHEGHLSLIRQARQDCSLVVVSIFVNPTQFGAGEDYQTYPRDIERDKKLAEEEGVDLIFAPTREEMYSPTYHTFAEVEGLSEKLCGKSRTGHFRGVTTVVLKLFNIIKPDIAYFGQKDYQQAVIIKKMVSDLDLDIKIKLVPVIRENDGLAMSSRNAYLSKEEREAAGILYKSLTKAQGLLSKGEKNTAKIIDAIRKLLNSEALARIDYASVVDPGSLEEIDTVKDRALVALAVRIGNTRLIDNIIFRN